MGGGRDWVKPNQIFTSRLQSPVSPSVKVLLWPLLFFVQLFIVCVVTVIAGSIPIKIPPRGWSILEFAPALLGIPFALSLRWSALESSGKWIWVLGLALAIYDASYHGLCQAGRQFTEDPIMGAFDILTLACMFYSHCSYVPIQEAESVGL